MQEELIAKKELLRLTGISYGQLYRWKRQNLIPESWFIKQASFTGQETFFPKDKILKRVAMITELKDRYSLEELAELFSPQSTGKLFTISDLENLNRLEKRVIARFQGALGKDKFDFREILFIDILSQVQKRYSPGEEALEDMTLSIKTWLPKLKSIPYRFVVCRRNAEVFSLLIQQDIPLQLDHKINELAVFELDEVAKDLNLELNKTGGEGQ